MSDKGNKKFNGNLAGIAQTKEIQLSRKALQHK